jgi:hypothetical protein
VISFPDSYARPVMITRPAAFNFTIINASATGICTHLNQNPTTLIAVLVFAGPPNATAGCPLWTALRGYEDVSLGW